MDPYRNADERTEYFCILATTKNKQIGVYNK